MKTAHAEDIIHVLVEVGNADGTAFGLGLAFELHEESQAGRRDILQLLTINLQRFVGKRQHLVQVLYLGCGNCRVKFADKANTSLLVIRNNVDFHIGCFFSFSGLRDYVIKGLRIIFLNHSQDVFILLPLVVHLINDLADEMDSQPSYLTFFGNVFIRHMLGGIKSDSVIRKKENDL